ncbi:hypothetical protein K6Y31_18750 [Motilimonas cestriensis]|uniref:Uncharacterized protein n=1 Tax=Motilimonas cestriensis TaxID=2742685 RepID=A0ABS8WE24_9GAMM|nr:hypothetical protein [Motilimonas cestriensis]MCE2596818.1 hypothetical protein [Motilimonas cestriensis]
MGVLNVFMAKTYQGMFDISSTKSIMTEASVYARGGFPQEKGLAQSGGHLL